MYRTQYYPFFQQPHILLQYTFVHWHMGFPWALNVAGRRSVDQFPALSRNTGRIISLQHRGFTSMLLSRFSGIGENI